MRTHCDILAAVGCSESKPSDYVEALVSGLPTYARKGRLILVFQGFFDDSGSHANEPFYVLAGFVSTVDKWKVFSDEWQAKLDEFPGLRYFKMSEANAMAGQFRSGWNPQTRDQRVFELAEIIKKHAMVRVTSSLKRSDFEAFCTKIVDLPEINDPYFMCFYQLVFAINSFQLENGNAECDLIFDEQGIIGPRTLLAWEGAKEARVSKERMALFQGLSLPIFRSDLKFLPLQAADMFAWTVRAAKAVGGKDNLNVLAQAVIEQLRPLRGIDRTWTRDELLEMGVRMLVRRSKELGII